MKVVILAGGLGTRLSEETDLIPKPMVEIGGRPILWHIMKQYEAQGFNDFVIALGYKGELIKRYFVDYYRTNGNIIIHDGQVIQTPSNDPWTIRLVDTGQKTMTGGRLRRLMDVLRGDKTFMLTYGDGVSDVDLNALLVRHKEAQALATITAVRPPARFGGLQMNGPLVTAFTEKPQIGEGWINGGFMALETRVLNLIQGDDDVLESDVLEVLATKSQLAAHRHDGFWQCMDTLREKKLLQSLWDSGNAPWKVWK